MIGATIFAVVFFVFLIAICIGFIILQIRLSKMDSKWPGLVLPAITLLLSLVAAITVFARADIGAYGNMWNVVLSAFIAFLSNNVSTIVLAGIYLYQRVSRESPQPRPSDIALPRRDHDVDGAIVGFVTCENKNRTTRRRELDRAIIALTGFDVPFPGTY